MICPMEVQTFRFAWRRRIKTALYPLCLAGALAGVHVLWVRLGSWVSIVLLATVALLVMRALQWLWAGRAPLRIDSGAAVLGRVRISLRDCEVHLRTRHVRGSHGGAAPVRVDEIVLLSPVGPSGQRAGFSFDASLRDFEKALRILLQRVPDARVHVRAPGGKAMEPQTRERLLATFFDDPLQRALAQVGRPTLLRPPTDRGT